MDIAPIMTQRDYRRALKRIENSMTAKRGTPEGDCLDVLVTLVEGMGASTLPARSSQSGSGDQIPYGSERT